MLRDASGDDGQMNLKQLVLQETLNLEHDKSFIKLQSDLSQTHFFLQDAFYEHFALFALYIVIGFLICSFV